MYYKIRNYFVYFIFLIGSQGSDETVPPPKPSRYPGSEIEESNTSLVTLERNPLPVSSYIVAQNPEVLVHLLKENESRGLNPSVYTTPASAFNTIAVDFKENTSGSGFSEFSNTDKTISAGDSLQSLNSINSNLSIPYSNIYADKNIVSKEVFINISNSSNCNKSLPRNFGSGGGKLSAHIGHINEVPRKSFSISSNEINEPISLQNTVTKISLRMSKSVDSASVVEEVYTADKVRLLFNQLKFWFFHFVLQKRTCMTARICSISVRTL